MSSDLYWAPARIEPHGKKLPRALKYIVARGWWNHDGSLSGDERMLTEEDAPYLRGIRDASADRDVRTGAQELLDAIEEHGAIEVSIRQ